MALALNTSHSLYANILSFICNDGGVVKDLKNPAETLTPDAAVTFGSGAYGAHFQTSNSGDSYLGVPLPAALRFSLNAANQRTLYIVTNGHVSAANRAQIAGNDTDSGVVTIGLSGTAAGIRDTGFKATGTTDVTTGAHSISMSNDGARNTLLYVDGVQEAAFTFANTYGSLLTGVGGSSGGRGYWANKFVYFIWFDKVLSAAEQAALHASLGADNSFALLEAAGGGDTTPPTLTSPTGTQTGATTASGTVSTDEGNGTLYYLASTNASETATTVKAASSQAVSATGSQSVSFTGLTASTTYYAHYVHRDAAGNDSTVASSASFTTSAAGDTTPPTLAGSITISALTTTSYTATWPAGSDDTAVTGYEYRIAGGSWVDAGDVLTVDITGRTPGATETFEVRAYDAVPNYSSALSTSVTLNSATATVTVTEPLKNNTGTLLASQSGITVAVLQAADLVSVYEATGLTTNASGLLAAISNAAMTTGQQYHVAIKLADGGVGITGPITAS